jgi:hypothetical protein
MNDNSAPSNADHYRALADDAYAASERLFGDSQRIMRQIAVSYHRLAAIADENERTAALDLPPSAMPAPASGAA